MNVLVDDVAVEIEAPTLAEAFRAARQNAQRRGRVVVDATLDGVNVPDDLLAQPTDDEFAGSLVKFQNADPGELVAQTLRGVGDALGESRAEHISAAELIQKGQIEDAMNRLTVALGVWEQARTAVLDGSALMGISVSTIGGKEADAEAAITGLADKLAEIKRAFVSQDWPALSDVLAYDMPEQVDRWQAMLGGIASAMESRAGATTGN